MPRRVRRPRRRAVPPATPEPPPRPDRPHPARRRLRRPPRMMRSNRRGPRPAARRVALAPVARRSRRDRSSRRRRPRPHPARPPPRHRSPTRRGPHGPGPPAGRHPDPPGTRTRPRRREVPPAPSTYPWIAPPTRGASSPDGAGSAHRDPVRPSPTNMRSGSATSAEPDPVGPVARVEAGRVPAGSRTRQKPVACPPARRDRLTARPPRPVRPTRRPRRRAGKPRNGRTTG